MSQPIGTLVMLRNRANVDFYAPALVIADLATTDQQVNLVGVGPHGGVFTKRNVPTGTYVDDGQGIFWDTTFPTPANGNSAVGTFVTLQLPGRLNRSLLPGIIVNAANIGAVDVAAWQPLSAKPRVFYDVVLSTPGIPSYVPVTNNQVGQLVYYRNVDLVGDDVHIPCLAASFVDPTDPLNSSATLVFFTMAGAYCPADIVTSIDDTPSANPFYSRSISD